jgi:hypothetical protein
VAAYLVASDLLAASVVRIPLEINSEWFSLSSTDDRSRNLESIAVIRSWLDDASSALTAGKGSSKEPKLYGHAKSNTSGVTRVEFDGVETATLRYWLEWWTDPARSSHGREEAGRDPAAEAEKIRNEIHARDLDL